MKRCQPRVGARARGTLGVLLSLAALAACDRAARSTPTSNAETTDVFVTVRAGAIVAPDSVRPGWRRVHVAREEGAHIVVLFRLADTTNAAHAVSEFIAALDTAPATPRSGRAIGGYEGGASGDVILHLTPGAYVIACLRRGADGHRHAHDGEFATLVVPPPVEGDSTFASPPPSAHTVNMIDFAYLGPERWTRGTQFLRIENTGQQDHQVRLARLREGASLRTWMTADDPDTVATLFAGMARVGPGEAAYLPVDLAPGAYVAYCLVPDAKTRQPHVELGMVRLIQVP